MKIKFILLFICLQLSINYVFAQSMRIAYQEIFENAGNTLDRHFDLILTDSASVYIETSYNLLKGAAKEEAGNKSTIEIDIGDKTQNNIYFNNRDFFVFIETHYGEAIAIQEDKEVIQHNWKYVDSTKTIGPFTCKLATTEFRGRNYSVWYTEDIPTDFGPWKFKNLPGLALQVTEDKGQFSINALQVESISADNTKEDDMRMAKAYKEIHAKKKWYSIEEFKEFIEEKIQALLSRIHQQFPKGTSMLTLDKDCKDCGTALEIY